MFKKQLDEAWRAITRASCCVHPEGRRGAGMVLAKPASITPHTNFKGEVYVLSKEEGAVIRRSSRAIVRSSTSARRT